MLVDSTGCISASYEAKCFGVKTGPSVEEAQPWLYRQTHERVVEAMEQVVSVPEVLTVGQLHFQCRIVYWPKRSEN
jgi:DNA polymerase-4